MKQKIFTWHEEAVPSSKNYPPSIERNRAWTYLLVNNINECFVSRTIVKLKNKYRDNNKYEIIYQMQDEHAGNLTDPDDSANSRKI